MTSRSRHPITSGYRPAGGSFIQSCEACQHWVPIDAFAGQGFCFHPGGPKRAPEIRAEYTCDMHEVEQVDRGQQSDAPAVPRYEACAVDATRLHGRPS